jgi:hypothetical protein
MTFRNGLTEYFYLRECSNVLIMKKGLNFLQKASLKPELNLLYTAIKITG